MIKINIQHKLNSSKDFLNLNLNFNIEQGKITALFGESGAGKTTILKIISGLIKPQQGRIEVGDELWFDSSQKINISLQKRNIGFVFQDYALFPNMTVKENIAYASKSKQKVKDLLELMNLQNLASSYPSCLSGGQAQRVALARALAKEPKILLLDEPLSALDFKMRSTLQDELSKILHHFKLTTLLVSHDLAEIYKLSHTILEIKNGKITKQASKNEFFKPSKESKLNLSAILLEKKKHDSFVVLTLLLNQELINITLKEDLKHYENIKIGDTVILSVKNFNPSIASLS